MTQIIELLKENGISSTGSFATLPEAILEAVSDVEMFGFEYWEERTVFGSKIKGIVKQLTSSGL